jgi:hypothetical protein
MVELKVGVIALVVTCLLLVVRACFLRGKPASHKRIFIMEIENGRDRDDGIDDENGLGQTAKTTPLV